MRKEDIGMIIQLLSSMLDSAEKLEEAYYQEDSETLSSAKREILNLQEEIGRIL